MNNQNFNNLLLTFCLCILAFSGQSKNLDSLWSVWEDESQDDTVRLEALNTYAWSGFLFSNPDSAFYYAQLQYDYAESKGLKMEMARSLNTQGVSFLIKSNYDEALEYFKGALKVVQEIGDRIRIAKAMNNIALIYKEKGDFRGALDYHQRSLQIQQELGDKKSIALTYNNIGLIYNTLGNYPKALDNHERSLRIREEIGERGEIAASLNNISTIYILQNEFIKALEFCMESLEIYEELNDQRGIAATLNNLGSIYNSKRDYTKSLEFHQRGLQIREEQGNKQGVANSLNNIGIIHKHLEDYSKALHYFKRSLIIREEIDDKVGISTSLVNVGDIYRRQASYSKALDYCKQGLNLAEQIKALARQDQACNCLYQTYKIMGKDKEALLYLEKIRVVEDSLQKVETTKKLQKMEFQKVILQDSINKADEARKVLESHETEIREEENIRNWSFAGGFLALLLAGGFFSRWRYVRKSNHIITKEKERSENLLLNILPEEIAEELKIKGKAEARDFDMVSILFTDFKGFTAASAKLSAHELVSEINVCFKAFDQIMEEYGIEKIKTIGDAYMAASGLHIPRTSEPKDMVKAALRIQEFILNRKQEREQTGLISFEMRAGIHTGPVVAGIVGVKKFQYDIWGDTVNTASRMESNGEVGKVNISNDTYELIKEDSLFSFESRGKIDVKGKGEMEMFFVQKK